MKPAAAGKKLSHRLHNPIQACREDKQSDWVIFNHLQGYFQPLFA